MKSSQRFFSKALLSFSILSSSLFFSPISKANLEFQWDPDPNFVRLKSFQTSSEVNDRSTYYLFLRPRERKTGILKLSIKIPDYFRAKIKPEKLSFCHVKIGGFTERTRCLKTIPAIYEINENQTQIDIFPDQPIPSDKKSYAFVMKIRNPRLPHMYQFHAYAQAPGSVPISGYMGTWSLDVD